MAIVNTTWINWTGRYDMTLTARIAEIYPGPIDPSGYRYPTKCAVLGLILTSSTCKIISVLTLLYSAQARTIPGANSLTGFSLCLLTFLGLEPQPER